jgi:hypothetical protein
MNKIFRAEFSRALINKRFILVFILAAISFSYGFREVEITLEQSPFGALTCLHQILARGKYGFFAAAMAALPFADSLSKDKNDHILDMVLTRTGYSQYLRAKTLAVMLSGACAVLLPALIILIGCWMFYPGGPETMPNLYFNVSEALHSDVIMVGSNLDVSVNAYLGLSLVFLALFGAAYALLAMSISFHTKNSMLVLGTAFVGYSFTYYIIPTSRHLNWMVSPRMALVPQGNLYSPLIQYSLIAIFFLVNLWIVGKKEKQVLD